MKLRDILLNRKAKIFAISILILLFTYIILRFLIFDSDPVIPFLSSLANSYLLLIEKFANQLLHWAGSMVTIKNHLVVLNNTQLDGFIPEIRFKKWMALFLFLVWITKTSIRSRTLFTFLLIIAHFLVLSIYNAVGAHLTGLENQDYSMLSIPVTLGLLCMITILFFWYRKYKMALLTGLSKLKINTSLLENELRVIIVIYIYIIASNFLFEFFDYDLWINFLFTSSQKILALLGYEAFVETKYLIGANGSIAMAKGCLGFQTMFLFAILVFLTGDKNKYRWIYIFAGLIFLNFVNIMRFVFLFIYIQKHGAYLLAMDVHDMFNYITYSFVFVLWVIWFEKFADIGAFRKK
ncbi:MAG TPA: hypothetical protein VIL99_19120 [Ignavibacteria bacterium]